MYDNGINLYGIYNGLKQKIFKNILDYFIMNNVVKFFFDIIEFLYYLRVIQLFFYFNKILDCIEGIFIKYKFRVIVNYLI